MNGLPEVGNSFKPKSFWAKKEGTTGMIVAVAGILAAGFGLYTILPFIITLLENAIYAALLFAGIAGGLYVISDPRFRTLIAYAYKSAMRAVTGVFTTIDPIGILKNYISDLEDSLSSMDKQIQNLRGQLRKLANAIASNEESRRKNLQIAKTANEKGEKALFVLNARKAGRLEKSNMTLQELHDKMELLYRALRKMYEVTTVVLEDLKDEVEVQVRQHEMIKAGYSAFKNAMNILRGQGSQKELFDRTMEYLAEDFGQKVGEIEHFIEVSETFIRSVDLENGIYEENAIKMLEEWEKQGDSILLGPSEKKMLAKFSTDPKSVINFDEPLPDREKIQVEVKEKKEEKRKHLEGFFSSENG